MKLSSLALALAMALLALVALLNWSAFSAPTLLNLGVAEVQAPLGIVLLIFTGLLSALFLFYIVVQQAGMILEARRTAKELKGHREVADQGEASRFTELREFLRTEMQATAKRDAELSDQLLQKMDTVRTGLAETIELTGNGLGASLGELEDRFVRQFPPANDRG